MTSYDSLSDLPGEIVLQIRMEDLGDDVYGINIDFLKAMTRDDLELIYATFVDVVEAELSGDVEVFEA